ncbi:GNAT family N-acetyltransferase [Paenibacillus sp. HJL G12]|uniref:GNAT family N-acetyltransferase n=1 Tax=Paenibacillus dendrobii TaxID=2691084 RepID=A0A7X3LHU8_9BACL|nr:GNAT family N-acetyltransferase [Paenibacillus dendrobii]MWV43639.1 GNAT family N-acetyltransferase [Paenibacillus dendrobii]
MNILTKGDLAVRPLLAEDAPLLSKWLSDPKVLEFYEGRDRPLDLKLVTEQFYREDSDSVRNIILYRDKPIGYIQYYEIDDEEREHYGYADTDDRIFGMDQFIGEPGCWNQGIGTQLIRAMTAYLFSSMQADRIVMDPQAWNKRAIHVYEKCGFVKKKLLQQHEWHEGAYRDCWLIELAEPEAAADK